MLVRDSACIRLDTLTAPIGLFPNLPAAQCSVNLVPGDWLLIASDGIPEACSSSGEEFGAANLLTLLDDAGQVSPAAFCQLALAAAAEFSGGPTADDMTLVVAHLLTDA